MLRLPALGQGDPRQKFCIPVLSAWLVVLSASLACQSVILVDSKHGENDESPRTLRSQRGLTGSSSCTHLCHFSSAHGFSGLSQHRRSNNELHWGQTRLG